MCNKTCMQIAPRDVRQDAKALFALPCQCFGPQVADISLLSDDTSMRTQCTHNQHSKARLTWAANHIQAQVILFSIPHSAARLSNDQSVGF